MTRRFYNFILLILTSMAVIPCSVFSESQFRMSSSPNIVGSGARALGVGGAFIAIADDATAASWNPAALIILKRPEAAVMMSYEDRKRFGTASFTDFNYIAVSYPFNFLKRNMIVSLNYQRLIDFNSKMDRTFADEEHVINIDIPPDIPPSPGGHRYIFKTDTFRSSKIDLLKDVTGDIGAIAPAFAIQITPKISFGFTINFWMDGLVNDGYSSEYKENQSSYVIMDRYVGEDLNDDGDLQDNEILQTFPGNKDQIVKTNLTYRSKYKFSGLNANIGLLWSATRKLTVGMVYKAPFTATADFAEKLINNQRKFDSGDGVWIVSRDRGEIDMRYKITFPAVYGLGLAWRFNDKFTMALDTSYTPWDDFVVQEYIGTKKNVATGFGSGGEVYHAGLRTSGINGVSTKYADIDGVITARLGAEYLFIMPKTVVPVRIGLVYDPEPAQGHPDDFYAATGGTGVMLFNRILLDLAYQYRWSESATLFTVTKGSSGDIVEEVHGKVTQHIVMLSTIVHF